MRTVGNASLSEGEICVRGESVCRGYLANNDAGLPVAEGWLYTGDLGRRNADGTITFVGLVKPMFTRNGFNVYPREIETVIGAMPGVERVEVRAIPRPSRENDIAVSVRGPVEATAVKQWCETHLSAYKQPRVIHIG